MFPHGPWDTPLGRGPALCLGARLGRGQTAAIRNLGMLLFEMLGLSLRFCTRLWVPDGGHTLLRKPGQPSHTLTTLPGWLRE